MLRAGLILVLGLCLGIHAAQAQSSAASRCLDRVGATQDDLALSDDSIDGREALRNRILRDMSLSRALASAGCGDLAQLFRNRANGFKPALRSFTSHSIAVSDSIRSFQSAARIVTGLAPIIAAAQSRASQSTQGGGSTGSSNAQCQRSCHGQAQIGTWTNGHCFYEATCTN
ncbi:MAG: hypothetical protein GC146_05240 [Limimaricola sp.]|uniref:hypothetical protein n=1 Tax=Limimaricola sp. TaxID=2211665 RepID=UPI001D98D14A|nr:hypothetical protein [Limimaricola sp.]MBI1416611.1 hypothetical protein [Limimaricola sp.]